MTAICGAWSWTFSSTFAWLFINRSVDINYSYINDLKSLMLSTCIWESLRKITRIPKGNAEILCLEPTTFSRDPWLFFSEPTTSFSGHDPQLFTLDPQLFTHHFLPTTVSYDFFLRTQDFLPKTFYPKLFNHNFLPTTFYPQLFTHNFLPTTHNFFPTTFSPRPTTVS